MYCDIK
jgi:hypothetical protein